MNMAKILIVHLGIQLNVLAQSSKGIMSGKYGGEEEFTVTEKYFDSKDNYDEDYEHGNPDNYEIIVRPCADFDRFCIRQFFAENSECKIAPGPIKEPFYVAENQLYVPNNNFTTTFNNVLFSGLNGRIEEFFINKATGNLVISIFFDGIKAEATPTYLRFNRNGQEPVEVMALAAIDYIKTAITIIIPNYKNLKLENAEVFAYVGDPEPPFIITPFTLDTAADPTVVADTASLAADVPTATIENMVTVAPLVAKIFIQKNICDFGITISLL